MIVPDNMVPDSATLRLVAALRATHRISGRSHSSSVRPYERPVEIGVMQPVRNDGAGRRLREKRRLCRLTVQLAILANLSPKRDGAGSDGKDRYERKVRRSDSWSRRSDGPGILCESRAIGLYGILEHLATKVMETL